MRDPIWQFVAAILTALAVAVTIWIALKRTHGLSYEFRVDSLATIARSGADDIQILFHGTPVPDVSLLRLRIVNTGRQPIRSVDFESPLRITFGTACYWLRAELERTTPVDLNVGFYPAQLDDEGKPLDVTVPPLLLNPGDAFTLKLIVAGKEVKPSIHGRVANIAKFANMATTRESQRARLLRTALFGILLALAIVLVLWAPGAFTVTFATIGFLAYSLFALIATALLSQRFDRRFVDRDRL